MVFFLVTLNKYKNARFSEIKELKANKEAVLNHDFYQIWKNGKDYVIFRSPFRFEMNVKKLNPKNWNSTVKKVI